MKPVVFITAGVLALGAVVIRNGGYFDSAPPLATAKAETGDGWSQSGY